MRTFAGTVLVVLAAIIIAVRVNAVFRQSALGHRASLSSTHPPTAWLIPLGIGATGVLLLASDRKRTPAMASYSAPGQETQAKDPETVAAMAVPARVKPVVPAAHVEPIVETRTAERTEAEPSRQTGTAPGKIPWVLPSIDWILAPDPKPPTQQEIDHAGRSCLDLLRIFGVAASYVGGLLTEAHVNYTFSGPVLADDSNHPNEEDARLTPIHKVQSDSFLRTLFAQQGLSPASILRPDSNSDTVVLQVDRKDLGLSLRRLMKSWEFNSASGALVVALGESLERRPVVVDLAKCPHLFVGGTTGSGKSVLLNAILTCLLLTHTPDSLRLVLIDPSTVELGPFASAPHLMSSNIIDARSAASVLYWVEGEIRSRSRLFGNAGVSNLERYNAKSNRKLPYIVVVIDEFAGLGFDREQELSEQICRLVETGRALGIHMIISTNSPMQTGKSRRLLTNIATRVVFRVAASNESYRLLDTGGAEQLPPCGIAIFATTDKQELTVVRTPMVSDIEIQRLVNFWKSTPTTSAVVT